MQLAATQSYDVVVTDLRMPEMNGHTFSVDLLAKQDPPVLVVLTGVSEPKIAKDLHGRGVDDIMFKPIDQGVVAVKVLALVESGPRGWRPPSATPAPSAGGERAKPDTAEPDAAGGPNAADPRADKAAATGPANCWRPRRPHQPMLYPDSCQRTNSGLGRPERVNGFVPFHRILRRRRSHHDQTADTPPVKHSGATRRHRPGGRRSHSPAKMPRRGAGCSGESLAERKSDRDVA